MEKSIMNNGREIQQLFFESIKQRLPKHISLVHEIAEILGISYDSTYRRLRGDKDLSIEEMKTLSHKYRISIDSLFGQTNADVLFHPFALKEQEDGFEEWLKLRVIEVKKIAESGIKEVIMVARDLPVYYYFSFPELAAFKLFFWKKMLIHHSDYHNKLFNINEISGKVLEVGRKLLTMYNQIPGVEIWCQETFTKIMQQIEFCRVSGFLMNKHDAEILFEKLEILIRHIQYQTELGIKFNYGDTVPESNDENFKVFVNEVLLIDNTVFMNRDGLKTIFMTHNSLDILLTTNPAFCSQVEHALRIIMKTGNHISGTSGLESNRFFSPLYEKLEEFKKESVSYKYII
jgi:hypothetical protein